MPKLGKLEQQLASEQGGQQSQTAKSADDNNALQTAPRKRANKLFIYWMSVKLFSLLFDRCEIKLRLQKDWPARKRSNAALVPNGLVVVSQLRKLNPSLLSLSCKLCLRRRLHSATPIKTSQLAQYENERWTESSSRREEDLERARYYAYTITCWLSAARKQTQVGYNWPFNCHLVSLWSHFMSVVLYDNWPQTFERSSARRTSSARRVQVRIESWHRGDHDDSQPAPICPSISSRSNELRVCPIKFVAELS